MGKSNLGKIFKILENYTARLHEKEQNNRKLQDMKKECKRTTELPKKKKKTIKTKPKTDSFQRLFDTITNIVCELWLDWNIN